MAWPNGRGGWDLSDDDVAEVMAASFDKTTHCANCGAEVEVDKPHSVGECRSPEEAPDA